MLMSHQTAYYSKFIGSQLYKEYCETVKKPVVARAYRKWMKKDNRAWSGKRRG